jgi:hypothetical protein
MDDVVKQIAKSVFVHQSTNVGLKVINNRRLTQADEAGFWLSLFFFAITHLPNE